MKIVEDNPNIAPSGQVGTDNATLQSLERYWRTLRQAQQVPSRNDIEPSQIDAALPHAFILQRVAPGIARTRVAGQHLHSLLRMDARGMPISTFFLPEARDEVAKLVEASFSEPAIISIPLISPGSLVRSQINGRMLLLPLRDDKGATTRILGALVTEGEVGSRPRRFSVTANAPIRHETLGPKLTGVQGLVHNNPIKKPGVGRPALRLVVNNG